MFSDVLNAGQVTSVNVDTNQSDKLLRLLDTVVIKLEGGTDEDLKVLDEKQNIEHKSEPAKEPLSAAASAILKAIAPPTTAEVKNDGGDDNDNDEDSNEIKELDPNQPNDGNSGDKPVSAEEKPTKKRKRTTSGSSSSSSSSTSSSGKLTFVTNKLTIVFFFLIQLTL